MSSLYFAAVNAEFNWWLLIVGLVVGGGLVWFVLADSRRREVDIDALERSHEAEWLAAELGLEGFDISADAAERMLELHGRYLDSTPQADLGPDDDPETDEWRADEGPTDEWRTTDRPTDDRPTTSSGCLQTPLDDRVRVQRATGDVRE